MFFPHPSVIAKRIIQFWGYAIPDNSGCWVYTGTIDTGGYGLFYWFGKRQKSNRMAWFLEHGPIPQGKLVLHHCDRPACVNPAHLWIGTDKDNCRDRESKGRGRQPRGMGNGMSKLTDDLVREIRRRVAGGETRARLAVDMGLCINTIYSVTRRERWTHVS